MEVDVAARHGKFQERGDEFVGVELAGGEGEGAEGAFHTGDACRGGWVVDVLDVTEVDGAVLLELSECPLGVFGGFGVEKDVRGPGQVEVAVDAFLLDELFHGVYLAHLVAGDGCCDFGSEEFGVLWHIVIRVGLHVSAISASCTRAEFTRFEKGH